MAHFWFAVFRFSAFAVSMGPLFCWLLCGTSDVGGAVSSGSLALGTSPFPFSSLGSSPLSAFSVGVANFQVAQWHKLFLGYAIPGSMAFRWCFSTTDLLDGWGSSGYSSRSRRRVTKFGDLLA